MKQQLKRTLKTVGTKSNMARMGGPTFPASPQDVTTINSSRSAHVHRFFGGYSLRRPEGLPGLDANLKMPCVEGFPGWT